MGTHGADRDAAGRLPAGANADGPDSFEAEAVTGREEAIATLAENKLLQTIPPEVLQRVEDMCRWRQLATHEVVFDQDDSSQDVYFIVRGKLRILVFRGPAEQDGEGLANGAGAPDRPGGTGSDESDAQEQRDADAESHSVQTGNAAFEELMEEGAPMTLTELVAGDTFGELSAIDGRMRSARAVALEPSLVAILDGPSFVDLVRGQGDLALALLRRVAGYLRTSNRRMYNLSTLTAKQRVYAQLSRLAEVHPHRRTEWIIDPLPPHTDIAFWAGTKRETVAAAIGWLAREGIVARQNRVLLIREPDRLRDLAKR
ncbi:Crp/Fnr family transcriptional regulator [Roseospira navarrensis]|nr:Crp/Fnr family transcriptional regulator [Roseospira navarrensis]